MLQFQYAENFFLEVFFLSGPHLLKSYDGSGAVGLHQVLWRDSILTQQNSYSISHLLGTCLDSDSVVTFESASSMMTTQLINCVVTMLPEVNNVTTP